MKKFYIKTLMVIVIFAVQIQAQYVSDISKRGTSAAPFLKVAQGARAVGMGGAFVGVANDVSSIYWNVAGIAKLKDNSFIFDHTEWIANLQYNYIAGSLSLGNLGTLGISLLGSNYGDMNVTTIDEPNGTGEVFSVKDFAVSIAYAINLTEDFAIGFNPKVVYESIWKTSAYAIGIDMGVLYKTPFKGITLGMSITNFSSKMKLTGTSEVVLHDPDPSTTGNNGRIPAEISTESWSLPLTFTLGVSYKLVYNDMNKLVIDIDAHHPNDDYESVSIGGEYVFKDVISLRAGYKTLFLKNTEETFALGAGLNQRILGNIKFHIDYAYQHFGRLTNVQKITVGIDF